MINCSKLFWKNEDFFSDTTFHFQTHRSLSDCLNDLKNDRTKKQNLENVNKHWVIVLCLELQLKYLSLIWDIYARFGKKMVDCLLLILSLALVRASQPATAQLTKDVGFCKSIKSAAITSEVTNVPIFMLALVTMRCIVLIIFHLVFYYRLEDSNIRSDLNFWLHIQTKAQL